MIDTCNCNENLDVEKLPSCTFQNTLVVSAALPVLVYFFQLRHASVRNAITSPAVVDENYGDAFDIDERFKWRCFIAVRK